MVDSLYRFAPPLFSLGLLRVDSPTHSHHVAYEKDKAFFASHRGRNLHIRLEYKAEFDVELPPAEYLQLPILHILVTQLATGIHHVTPIYRGSAFWEVGTTDLELATVVSEMARRGGIDPLEWIKFESEWHSRNHATIDSGGIIH